MVEIAKKIKKVEMKLHKIYDQSQHKKGIKLEDYYTPSDEIESLNDLMYKMMVHGQNGQGYSGVKLPNYSHRYNEECNGFLLNVLKRYNPQKICNTYLNVDSLLERFNSEESYYKKIKGRSKTNWTKEDFYSKNGKKISKVSYVRKVYYIAHFLKNFKTVDEFKKLFETINEKIPYSMSKCIEIIPGFGPAFSADFLKESEYANLIKPDVHLLGFIDECLPQNLNEIDIYYKVQELINALGENWTPYKFDKVVYLYCSRNFYLDYLDEPYYRAKKSPKKNNERRVELIKYIKGEIEELDEV